LVQGEEFNPAVLTVTAGTIVTWTNSDMEDHTVTSYTSIPSFNGYLNASGGTFSYTFTTSGTYPYYCTIHPYMLGTIIVK
jgi:plastocyanin